MPRIDPLTGTPTDPLVLKLLADGERDGTPDERMIRVFARSGIGARWIDFCHMVFTEGLLPVTLKELIRIRHVRRGGVRVLLEPPLEAGRVGGPDRGDRDADGRPRQRPRPE